MWGRKSFYFGDNISVGVRDLQRAVNWYPEKLSLRVSSLKAQDCDALLSFDRDDPIGLALMVIRPGQAEAYVSEHPILFTKRIKAAHEELTARGVSVGPIQKDSGGNSFFQSQGLDGNAIEICVEP
jgi:hypothetical protein